MKIILLTNLKFFLKNFKSSDQVKQKPGFAYSCKVQAEPGFQSTQKENYLFTIFRITARSSKIRFR